MACGSSLRGRRGSCPGREVRVLGIARPYTGDVDRAELRLDLDGEVGALYRSDGERLWRAVYGFAQNREVASDAVAEASAQCLARGDAVRSPKAWVWKAAFRIAAGDLQHRSRMNPLTGDPSLRDGGAR